MSGFIEGDGVKIWHDSRGQWHRLDGPAFEVHNYKTWYYHGEGFSSFDDFQKFAKLTNDQITILKLKYGDIM